MIVSLAGLQEIIGYRFRDGGLLKLALTHRSMAKAAHNQRLEFLGDRVLGLVVAEMLYGAFSGEQEGDLARRHAALVCGPALVEVAREIGLGAYLQLASGEEVAGGRENISNLEDACEALIGAMYLDSGLEGVAAFIRRYWTPLLNAAIEPPKDAKTALQEWLQGRGHPLPLYEEAGRSGPAHAPEFTIQVSAAGQAAEASALSKRAAEQAAAEKLLVMLSGVGLREK